MNQQAQTFFAQLVAGYQQAAAHAGSAIQSHYQIGGKHVRIGYASRACAQVFAPALQHLAGAALATTTQEADFTILVWDCVSTGAPPLRAPWSLDAYLPNRMVRGFCDERFRTITYHDTAICLMIDQQTHTAVYWRRDIHETRDYERAAPLRELFCWWMATQGRYFVHGGAIDGVFLAGVGGIGKSTTTLACLLQGIRWAGEDYVLLGDSEPPSAYSLYCTAKLSDFSLTLLPQYRASVMIPPSPQSEKAILMLYPRYAERLAPQVALQAVVLPTLCRQKESRLVPLSAGAIYQPLFSSTLMQIPSADTRLLRGIANVLRRLPCYRLEIGENLAQVVDCLRTLGAAR